MTARGGSKGLPGKNLRPLAGKPLLAHSIEAAQHAGCFDRLVLSTDDEVIAEVGRQCGCEVPFRRPSELAADDTPHLPVVQHAVRWLREHEGYQPDAVMILQPTSPLRRPADFVAARQLLAGNDADSVVSVSEVPAHMHPLRMLRISPDGAATLFASGEPVRRRINRRQDLPAAWVMNGAIYLLRTATLFGDEPSLYGARSLALPLPYPFGLSIDTQDDWDEAERAIAALTAQWISKRTAI